MITLWFAYAKCIYSNVGNDAHHHRLALDIELDCGGPREPREAPRVWGDSQPLALDPPGYQAQARPGEALDLLLRPAASPLRISCSPGQFDAPIIRYARNLNALRVRLRSERFLLAPGGHARMALRIGAASLTETP